jgi:hypothetical protein
MERVEGIEPSSQAWEARILPLNHTRARDSVKLRDGRVKHGKMGGIKFKIYDTHDTGSAVSMLGIGGIRFWLQFSLNG